MNRWRPRARGAVVAALLLGALIAQAPDARQIGWQRSLDDALAVAKTTDRPLLIALNMDGESASDRIVHELYRDPEFVALTRRCVCVVASLFRHTQRDHDDQGRRIPCPRLGSVTCGEHVGLESVLFEKYLADGERVAPRHALILQSGEKAFDLSLCFDLRDIERALRDSLGGDSDRGALPASRTWAELAARRDADGRAQLEAALAGAPDGASLADALDAIAQHGDRGSRDALRVVGARLPSLWPSVGGPFLGATGALHLESEIAGVVRGQFQMLGSLPGSLDPEGREVLLPVLAGFDSESAATRSLVLASLALDRYRHVAAAAAARAFTPNDYGRIQIAAGLTEVAATIPAVSIDQLLQTATATTRSAAPGELPRPNPITDQMPDREALAKRLDELDRELQSRSEDAELQAEYAKASLDLARRHIETNERDVQILLEDAELHFQRALELDGKRYRWWIERARTAYFRSRFELQVEYGQRAQEFAEDEARLAEARRWIGDGDARLLEQRASGDPVVALGGIVEGVRELGLVAASPYADAKDWLSFASICGAVGLWREELAILRAGAERLPASAELRQALNAALWNGGRIDLAPAFAEGIARVNPDSADIDWFTGYAYVLAAEQDRRREDPEGAIRGYQQAAAHFEHAAKLNDDYVDNCRYWLAMTWLGRGLAHVRAGRRAEAADGLLAAVGTGAMFTAARDGLGYDVLDLVDKILEWRESGPSPVDPLALLERLDGVAPENPFWAVAISDSELREALRADGRNPERVERETVDAGGKPIRALMGLPTEAGDRYLRASIEAGRRAAARAETEQDEQPLAQSGTIWAERMLERGKLDGVREALAEAAELLGKEPPAADADVEALRAKTAELRAILGPARPRERPGR